MPKISYGKNNNKIVFLTYVSCGRVASVIANYFLTFHKIISFIFMANILLIKNKFHYFKTFVDSKNSNYFASFFNFSFKNLFFLYLSECFIRHYLP